MRRAGLAAAVLALILGFSAWWSLRPVKRPPSLLLVTIDTLRADRVGAYGSKAGLTPAIDDLARRGWLFEHAVSAVPLTLPSHASLLSGLEPLHHGVRNNGTYTFPTDKDTLATRLKSVGYSTGAFVAAAVLDRRYGLARGFDQYDDRIVRAVEGRSVLESERPCDVVVANATSWLKARTGPYFAWVHIYEPHAPYAPPGDLLAAHPGRPYDAEVAAADRCVGSLLAAARQQSGDALVIAVASDHGEGLGEHGESTHGMFLYQSTLSVPMLIAGAGVESGRRTSGVVRGADLAPTLLALVGAPALVGVDGKNLVTGPPAGEAYAESDYATGFGWAPLRSWRVGDLKFVEAPKPELFDLTTDPREARNLADLRPSDVERLRNILRAAQASEVRGAGLRLDAEAEERLRSLGYVAGGGSSERKGAVLLDPKDAAPLLRGFEAAMTAEASGDLKLSVSILEDLRRRDPGNLTFLRSLASALSRSLRADESLRVLKDAERAAPEDPSTLLDLAVALAERGEVVQAIERDERAIAIDPAFVGALDHLATLRAIRGDFALARTAADRAVALDQNNARAWSNRGNIARAQNQPDEAVTSFRRAVELDPSLVDAVNGLGVLAVERRSLDEAAEHFARALEIDPELDEARLNLAVVEWQRGRLDKARSLAEQTFRTAKDPQLRLKAESFLRSLR